jgi:hypothetical protein
LASSTRRVPVYLSAQHGGVWVQRFADVAVLVFMLLDVLLPYHELEFPCVLLVVSSVCGEVSWM